MTPERARSILSWFGTVIVCALVGYYAGRALVGVYGDIGTYATLVAFLILLILAIIADVRDNNNNNGSDD